MILRRLLFGAMLVVAVSSCNRSPAPHAVDPYPEATQVRLFVETEYDETGETSFAKLEGLPLNEEERAELESALRVTKIPDTQAACFVPHHFFRYYAASGKQVGEIEVCFCCLGISAKRPSNIKLAADHELNANYMKLKKLVRKLGGSTDVNCN